MRCCSRPSPPPVVINTASSSFFRSCPEIFRRYRRRSSSSTVVVISGAFDDADDKKNVGSIFNKRLGDVQKTKFAAARVAVGGDGADDHLLNDNPALPVVGVIELGHASRTLKCMLRKRVTDNSGNERCVVLPLDAPIDVLRGEANSEDEDLSDIDDEELREILPGMQLALAKKGLLLQRSALCFTVRGPLRANYDDCLELDQGGDEAPQEAVECATFDSESTGFRYLVYAPLNPVLLVTKENKAEDTHEVVTEEPDEVVAAAIESVYEELTEGPDDELFLELERAEKEMKREKRGSVRKKK